VFNFAPFERTFEVDVEMETAFNGSLQCTDAWDGVSVYYTQQHARSAGEGGGKGSTSNALKLRIPARSSMLLQCRDAAA
jgi:hypothetical protein